MFARTARLMLRPGWPEDAAALAQAIGHEAVATKLMRVPWPYALGDAQGLLADWPGAGVPRCLIFDDPAGTPRLVGGIGVDLAAQDGPTLGYWLTPAAWGRGYATEAGRAVVGMARALGLGRLHANHFADNPASGRVLCKLGFEPTGRIAPRPSQARGAPVDSVFYELDLSRAGCGKDPIPLAA